MSAARNRGGGRRSEVMRSRAGRTLVALLGVSSLAVTAAAAEPLGLRSSAPAADVVAMGEQGFGSIDMLTLDGAAADGEGSVGGGTRKGGSVSTRGTVDDGPGSSLGPGAGLDPGLVFRTVPDGTYKLPVFGDETFASFVPSGLGRGTGIPAASLRAYRAAEETMAGEAPGCGIDWALLAGIGRVEANHGRFGGSAVSEQGVSVPRILGIRLDGSLAGTMVIRDSDGGALDGDTVYDRALGPMQFLPGTWGRWGSDGDQDGARNPQDIDDAALAAARYLCEGRSTLGDPAQAALAVRRYNNSSSYVRLVLATAESYRTGGPGIGPASLGTAASTPEATPVPVESTVPPAAPTPSATAPAPSAAPSPSPTTSPTSSPTTPPTTPPAPEPSVSPTTVTPGPLPTCSPPPVAPGAESTAEPTAEPTADPGAVPTLPGTLPSGEPSVPPTCLPAAVPDTED